MDSVDFGTYHHSTREESEKVRTLVEKEVTSLLTKLFPESSTLRVLDAGCGLGFMSYLAARCFPNALVTAVDTFDNESLVDSSMEKATRNMKALNLDSRVYFKKHDLRKTLDPETIFDLAISNLVFHNLGKERFVAYSNVLRNLSKGGYFVIADLFPRQSADMKFFMENSSIVMEKPLTGKGRWDLQLKVLQRKI